MADRAAGRARSHTARPISARATPRARLRVVPSSASRRQSAAAARVNLALLLIPVALLTVIGVIEVFSASSVSAYAQYGSSFVFFNRQVIYAVVGVVALMLASRAPYQVWRRMAAPLLVITVVLLLVALVSGQSAYGASRWIGFGSFTLQPSELAKLSLVAFTAMVLTLKWKKLGELGHLAVPLAPAVALVAGVVILQRDLGTTIILCGTVFMMLFVAGVRAKHLAGAALIGLASGALLIFGESYRAARFLSYRNPWADAKGAGYQLIQGYIALGSGGWFGVGLGASRQKWQYVPNAHTDFIFAILGEELGLIGEIVVLALFATLVYAGVRIAMRAPDTFGRLMAAGITSWLGLQTIVNLGAVTGLLPVTGVPLPFMSYGGSALIACLAGVGVLASIALTSGTPKRARPTSRNRRAKATR
jgi:cell division protein FtsW